MIRLILTVCCTIYMVVYPANAQNKVKYRCASIEEARRLLSTEDGYIRNLSPFDIVSRLENPNGTKEDFIQLSAGEVMEWTEKEKRAIDQMTQDINDTISKYNYNIPFPEEIILIKSPLKAEGGANGYTRNNCIVLIDGLFQDHYDGDHMRLLLHETFHILTRNNLEFKKQMYATIGFSTTKEELEYPKDLWQWRISNPDVSRYDSYATFTIDNRPQKCAMILYANRPYTNGRFFQYMNVGFVPLDDHLKPIRKGENTVVYSMDKVSDFYNKVGYNTRYIIHPEEIMADNFVIAFLNKQKVPTLALKEKVQYILKQSFK